MNEWWKVCLLAVVLLGTAGAPAPVRAQSQLRPAEVPSRTLFLDAREFREATVERLDVRETPTLPGQPYRRREVLELFGADRLWLRGHSYFSDVRLDEPLAPEEVLRRVLGQPSAELVEDFGAIETEYGPGILYAARLGDGTGCALFSGLIDDRRRLVDLLLCPRDVGTSLNIDRAAAIFGTLRLAW